MATRVVPRSCVFVLLAVLGSAAQTITGFNPQQAAQGSAFTLTITGTGFAAPALLQFFPGTGITVSNVSVASSSLITAQVQIGSNAPVGSQSFVVQFRGGPVKAPSPFNIIAGAPAAVPPTLTSVGPVLVTQGSQNVRLTLNGSNFRPGATVIISPPIAAVTASTAQIQAGDVAIQSVTRISDTLLLVEITLGQQAAFGLRAVDVVNVDGTSTGPTVQKGAAIIPGSRTSKPLNIVQRNSLAAPLQVNTIALSYPRDGTVLSEGDDIYGEMVLAGTGNGMIVGQWLWDGNTFEQFAVPMTGGTRVTVKTKRALPTLNLGPHLLAVRVTSPNNVQTRDVTIVVNPGKWKLEKVLFPPSDAGFPRDQAPRLGWALIPAAAYYQVGFARGPYYNLIEKWYDVNATEWRVPENVWHDLPDGQLYWTVRVVEVAGETRKPAPMRSLWKLPNGTLLPVSQRQRDGRLLLSWHALSGDVVYQISIQLKSRQQPPHYVVSRTPAIDLSAARVSFLQPGQTYEWQVEARYNGHRVAATGPQEFVVAAARTARTRAVRKFSRYQVASIGPPAAPPQLSTQISSRSPGPAETVRDPLPTIRVDFNAKINPADVAVTLDWADVTSLATITDSAVVLKPAGPLAKGDHSVIIRVGADSDSWKFKVDPPQEANTGTTGQSDAEPAAPSATSPGGPPSDVALSADSQAASPTQGLQESSGQIASNTQWISGSIPDTNVFTITNREIYHRGPWTAELNGSGLMNSVLGPSPQHAFGRFNDYVFRVAYDKERWKAGVRFGVLAPVLYTNSEFVTTGSAREGVEASAGTLVGRFAFFANTSDRALGGGAGVAFHQDIRGASYDAPIPERLGDLRFMWLSARDRSLPTTITFTSTGTPEGGLPLPGSPVPTSTFPFLLPSPGAGDAYGSLLLMKLGQAWTWTSEYSVSYENPNVTLATGRLFGRAWRSGVMGSWRKATISFNYRDVGPNFGTPANPSLSLNSNADRRGVDISVSRPFRIGTFTGSYQFLQSQVHSSTAPRVNLNSVTLGWSKDITPTTTLQIGAREVRTSSGELPAFVLGLTPEQQLALRADLRDAGLNASISRRIGTVTLTLGGTRDWLRNRLFQQQNVISSGINAGANWQGLGFFQINSNVSVIWISADKFTVGQTRTVTTYVQPMVNWKRAGLSFTPLVAVSNNNTQLGTGVLTTDSLTSEYVGRMSWTMPRLLKFSTLSLEGGQTHFRDAILGLARTDTRALLLWNVVWGYNRPAK